VPPLGLGGDSRLGFNTWLGRPDPDAADLLLSRHYAEPHIAKDSNHG